MREASRSENWRRNMTATLKFAHAGFGPRRSIAAWQDSIAQKLNEKTNGRRRGSRLFCIRRGKTGAESSWDLRDGFSRMALSRSILQPSCWRLPLPSGRHRGENTAQGESRTLLALIHDWQRRSTESGQTGNLHSPGIQTKEFFDLCVRAAKDDIEGKQCAVVEEAVSRQGVHGEHTLRVVEKQEVSFASGGIGYPLPA